MAADAVERPAVTLPFVLSLIAVSTDIIGFLGLNGLFTAHIRCSHGGANRARADFAHENPFHGDLTSWSRSVRLVRPTPAHASGSK
jgi:hypothetical protein